MPRRELVGFIPDTGLAHQIENYFENRGYSTTFIQEVKPVLLIKETPLIALIDMDALDLTSNEKENPFKTQFPEILLIGITENVDKISIPDGSVFDLILKKPVTERDFLYMTRMLPQEDENPSFPKALVQSDSLITGFLALIKELEMDESIIKQLGTSFITRGEMFLEELKIAFAANEHEEIYRIAHSFKGMAGNMRFETLTNLMSQIMIQSKQTDLNERGYNLKPAEESFRLCKQCLLENCPHLKI